MSKEVIGIGQGTTWYKVSFPSGRTYLLEVSIDGGSVYELTDHGMILVRQFSDKGKVTV